VSSKNGVSEWSWATEAWSARMMVLIGDTWQWTPFIFIVILAAIENQPRDQVEAARLDGAGGLPPSATSLGQLWRRSPPLSC
jgi:ABC-type sugar transport system permease subunit